MNCGYNRIAQHDLARRGTTMLEMVVAGILVGTIAMMSIPSLKWVVRQQQAAQDREVAMSAASNLMEQLTVQPWNRVTEESVAAATLPEWADRQLRDASISVTVTQDDADPAAEKNDAAKRIHIVIEWKGPSGEKISPVKLTAWMYRTETSS